MSGHDTPPTPEQRPPSAPVYWLSVLGALGVIFIFALIVYVAYIYRPNRPPAVDAEAVAKRLSILSETTARETQNLTGYDWKDRPIGVVRIPIEVAMQLTIERLRAGQEQPPPP